MPQDEHQGQPAEGLRANEVLLFRTALADKSDGKSRASDAAALARAQQLDLVLTDAIQDLGLTLDLSEGTTAERELTDLEVLARATKRSGWVVYPSIEGRDRSWWCGWWRSPRLQGRLGRIETIKASELAVRAVVMLRDVIAARSGTSATEVGAAPRRSPRAAEQPRGSGSFTRSVDPRLQWRALRWIRRLFGAAPGTGSDDPRLLFPLMALGTGWGSVRRRSWPKSGTSASVTLGTCRLQHGGPRWQGSWCSRKTEPDPPTEYSYAVVGALSGLSWRPPRSR